ncbi:MAG: 50S ribosomal protein L23 [Deltaproteobacteria bacterium]|nr:MAG: 50S ribosomal protein L23 [Deltaproteobacteria bacterium]
MNLGIYDIIRRPLITEKLEDLRERHNMYAFEVDRRANKIQIRDAVEKLFQVKVTNVRTQVVRGKPKRIGLNFGRRSSWKKAIVTLGEGHQIDFVEGATVPGAEE